LEVCLPAVHYAVSHQGRSRRTLLVEQLKRRIQCICGVSVRASAIHSPLADRQRGTRAGQTEVLDGAHGQRVLGSSRDPK